MRRELGASGWPHRDVDKRAQGAAGVGDEKLKGQSGSTDRSGGHCSGKHQLHRSTLGAGTNNKKNLLSLDVGIPRKVIKDMKASEICLQSVWV